MSIKLNRISVPDELQEAVEKISLERFPESSVTWVQESPGFIVLEIPDGDYGCSHDIDASGRKAGPSQSGDEAAIAGLEAKLQQYVRAHSEH